MSRASRWGRDSAYYARANSDLCLLVQVETREGLDNLEAIAATEGVDGVFIGPADLAASLGHLGNPGHPEVVTAIEQAIDTIVGSSKAPGILSADPALAERYIAKGCRFVAVGTDMGILARGAEALAAQFKAQVSAPTGTGAAY
jgi:4-hydroxy-2-oxoheptanedioate aldolase